MSIFFWYGKLSITLFYISRLRSSSSLFSFNYTWYHTIIPEIFKKQIKQELSPDPLRPWTVNFTISFQKLYMCSISKVPLRPLNLCSCTVTTVSSESHGLGFFSLSIKPVRFQWCATAAFIKGKVCWWSMHHTACTCICTVHHSITCNSNIVDNNQC